MNAAIYTRYGPPEVVRVAEIETPTPEDDEVRIRIIATTVAAVDAIFRRGDQKMARMFTGLFRPKRPVLGSEIAGVAHASAAERSGLRVGDQILSVQGELTSPLPWAALSLAHECPDPTRTPRSCFAFHG